MITSEQIPEEVVKADPFQWMREACKDLKEQVFKSKNPVTYMAEERNKTEVNQEILLVLSTMFMDEDIVIEKLTFEKGSYDSTMSMNGRINNKFVTLTVIEKLEE